MFIVSCQTVHRRGKKNACYKCAQERVAFGGSLFLISIPLLLQQKHKYRTTARGCCNIVLVGIVFRRFGCLLSSCWQNSALMRIWVKCSTYY